MNSLAVKVLIIEDEMDVAESLQGFLEDEGFEVEVGLGGKAGLAKVKSFFPDIILLDIIMPLMDGVSVLKALKADPLTKKIPVIMVTAISKETETRKKCEEVDATVGFVEKPFKIDTLLNEIAKQLK